MCSLSSYPWGGGSSIIGILHEEFFACKIAGGAVLEIIEVACDNKWFYGKLLLKECNKNLKYDYLEYFSDANSVRKIFPLSAGYD